MQPNMTIVRARELATARHNSDGKRHRLEQEPLARDRAATEFRCSNCLEIVEVTDEEMAARGLL